NHASGNSVVMGLLNYLPTGQNTYQSAALDAELKNCIVYGSLENELICDAKNDHPASILLDHCLIRSVEALPNWVQQNNLLLNQDPLFTDYLGNDHHLKEGSPAIQAGIQAGNLNTDLDGKPRQMPPSMGCYEWWP